MKQGNKVCILLIGVLLLFCLPILPVQAQYTNWSWDGANKILTIVSDGTKGYSEGTSYDSQDIIDSGLVPVELYSVSPSGTQFEFSFRIIIGDGSTTTWFIDTNKQIVFNAGSVSANSQYLIETKRYAHLRFGILETEANKITSSGCTFLSLVNSYKFTRFFYTNPQTGSEANFYSCSFNAPFAVHHFQPNNLLTDKIYHCNFINNVQPFGVASGEFYNIIVQNAYIGLYATGSIDRVWLGGHSSYSFYTRFSSVCNISNAIVHEPYGTLWGITSKSTNPIYAINIEAPSWTFTWGGTNTVPLYRMYSFDLHVSFPNGTVIQNANVTIRYYGQGGGIAFEGQTDSEGTIPTQTLTMGFYQQSSGDTLQSYNPYNLLIEYGDYIFNQNFTLTGQVDLGLALQIEELERGLTLGLGMGLVFVLVLVVILIGYGMKKKRG